MRKKTLNVKKVSKMQKIRVKIDYKTTVIINRIESFAKWKRLYPDAVILPDTKSITG